MALLWVLTFFEYVSTLNLLYWLFLLCASRALFGMGADLYLLFTAKHLSEFHTKVPITEISLELAAPLYEYLMGFVYQNEKILDSLDMFIAAIRCEFYDSLKLNILVRLLKQAIRHRHHILAFIKAYCPVEPPSFPGVGYFTGKSAAIENSAGEREDSTAEDKAGCNEVCESINNDQNSNSVLEFEAVEDPNEELAAFYKHFDLGDDEEFTGTDFDVSSIDDVTVGYYTISKSMTFEVLVPRPCSRPDVRT